LVQHRVISYSLRALATHAQDPALRPPRDCACKAAASPRCFIFNLCLFTPCSCVSGKAL